jgi:RNA polymerase sigma factor (TIGR02999 family)
VIVTGSECGADSAHDITRLLSAVREGDAGAKARLFERVYADLRRLAGRQVALHHDPATPSATTLVHELYLRMDRPGALSQVDRGHFFAVAARAMRQILVDLARARSAEKRGGGRTEVALVDANLAAPGRSLELLAVDAALTELEGLDSRLATVVEWRFFGGLSLEQIGAALGLTERTMKRDWRKARAFLHVRLRAQGIGSDVAEA